MIDMVPMVRPNAVCFRAVGRVTHADYVNVLIPVLEELLTVHSTGRLLCILDEAFDRFTAAALADDARWGTRHLGAFERIAIVTESDFIKHAFQLFAPLIAGDVHLYPLDELEEARGWIDGE